MKDIKTSPEELTLRDYFAGQALCGFCGNKNIQIQYLVNMGRDCYVVADTLIKERNK